VDRSDRAGLSNLGQAMHLAEEFPPAQVGAVADAFSRGWDPDVRRSIERAGAMTRWSLRSDLRSTWDPTAAPARTNPASFGR
jgi:hypothetical protein